MPFPCFHQRQGRDIALAALPSSIVRELAEVCREAWHGGMLAGCNGNASCRWQSPEGERIVITRSGRGQGAPDAPGPVRAGCPERRHPVRRSFVQRRPHASGSLCGPAPVRGHPAHPPPAAAGPGPETGAPAGLAGALFEAAGLRVRRLAGPAGLRPGLRAGTRELAEAVGQAARDFEAVWMTRHGLCASAPCLGQALALS